MQLRIKTVNEDGYEVEEVWLFSDWISNLLDCAHDCPESLRQEVQAVLEKEIAAATTLDDLRARREKSVLDEDDETHCQFVRITDPEAISWLDENSDWILDFVDLISSDVETLEEKQRAIQEQANATRNSMRYWQDMVNGSDESRIEYARLIHTDASIALALGFRTGKLRLLFPDDYDGPTSFGLLNKIAEHIERLLAYVA